MASLFEPLFTSNAAAQGEHLPGWLCAIRETRGFAAQPHLSGDASHAGSAQEDAPHDAAYAEGERAGRAAAMAEIAQGKEARERLGLALAQRNAELEERLAARLAETVAALCEATLSPLTIDPEALQRRCIAAAGAVGEGIIDASLRLHPDDIDLLDPDFASTWHLMPDPALERGTVEFDMPEGAVRDGPEEWRGALREALGLPPPGLEAPGRC